MNSILPSQTARFSRGDPEKCLSQGSPLAFSVGSNGGRSMSQLFNQVACKPDCFSFEMRSFETTFEDTLDRFDENVSDALNIDIDLTPLPSTPGMSHLLSNKDEIIQLFGNGFGQNLPKNSLLNENLITSKRTITEMLDDNELGEPSSKKLKSAPASVAAPDDNAFRAYQAEHWTLRFQELCEFAKEHGHCQVPHTFTQNIALARWIKRQRYQYKLRSEGKTSTMTDDRIDVLEKIGFVWDSHGAAWEDRRTELAQYKSLFGHCNVPSSYNPNRQLAIWVKRQRRQYKFFCEGKASSMTESRINTLESMGFEWELRFRESSRK